MNPKLDTGEIELRGAAIAVQSAAEVLPIQVAGEEKFPDELRLKYRFLDLRRARVHDNMVLRAQVIASIRRRMIEAGFTEFTTPILTASSPEGARDFLVPARLHPGKFYALPQAPQQFKQLLMVAGFDRYFQIAPCFRDEASRADRSPGEFYQLDFEMSFVTQEDVFDTIEPVIAGVFEEFARGRGVTPPPFPRIPYEQAMLRYGSDKPDLRNPLLVSDVSEHFAGSGFGLFARIVAGGGVVRAIPAPGTAKNPRSFFDKLNEWAREEGGGGLGYIVYDADGPKGPIARNLEPERAEAIRAACGVAAGDSVFFVAGPRETAAKFSGAVRTRLGTDLGLIAQGEFRFCWITDFPMYELNEETGQIDFSHNPFSMPQGGMEALEHAGPADDQGVPVRHRLQRRGAVIRRDPQPSAGHHDPGVRDRGLYGGGCGGAVRRHAERVPLWRAAARRLGAGDRPDRDAAGRGAEHPRGDPVPAQPAGRRPDDGRPRRDCARTLEGTAPEAGPAADAALAAPAAALGSGADPGALLALRSHLHLRRRAGVGTARLPRELGGAPVALPREAACKSGGAPVALPREAACELGGAPVALPREAAWESGGAPVALPREAPCAPGGAPAAPPADWPGGHGFAPVVLWAWAPAERSRIAAAPTAIVRILMVSFSARSIAPSREVSFG